MDPAAQLQPHLRPGESLLWCGKPDPRAWLAPADLYAIPFSLLVGAFAVYWEVTAVGSGPLFAQLWGLPFVVMGVYMIFGRFAYKYFRKKRTAYGITPVRAMVAGPRGLTDVPLRDRAVSVSRSRDSRHATVIIGDRSRERYANTGLEFIDRSGRAAYGFFDVADPDGMLLALEQARAIPPVASAE